MRLWCVWLCLLLAAGCAARAAEYEVHLEAGVMVPMRDGVKLAADVYRPARDGAPVEGKFPVVLYRTPYNKAGLKNAASYFARHGYVAVAQDVRGRFASQGAFYPFVNEGQDGYDSIEWAAAQPWSTGQVGTAGGSYLAWDQYHAAMYRPPHLAAMYAEVGGANFIDEYGYPGGIPNLGWPVWMLNAAINSQEAARNPEARNALMEVMKNVRAWYALDPQKRGELFAPFPAYRKVYQDFYDHPEPDRYWKQRGFYTKGYYREMKDVPTLFASGWYDYFLEGVLDNFMALSRAQKTEKRLVVGPWPHGVGAAECGEASFGPDAATDMLALAVDWFDHCLKGARLEKLGEEKVRIFRMGGGDGTRNAAGRVNHGGRWRAAPAWPPPEARTVSYFIGAGHTLDLKRPSAAGRPSTFVFDPDNPVPTIGGRYLGCARDQVCSPKTMGCADSLPLNRRPDVLSYETQPLAEALEVTGKVRARLWISSDAVDTDFTAKLVDVYPEGFALILTDGQLRARYRNGREKPRLMKPGTVYELNIDLGSVSNLFARGHRIRLDVSSSNYPRGEPNPNTGEPAGRWTARRKAANTVYHDAAHASFLELPIR
jgi:putative CocE/NonD family hydrolase